MRIGEVRWLIGAYVGKKRRKASLEEYVDRN